jgi:putative endonuclease
LPLQLLLQLHVPPTFNTNQTPRHPDRSAAKWRDPRISLLPLPLLWQFQLLVLPTFNTNQNTASSRPERSVVEGPPHFARSCNTLTMPQQAYVYILASSFQRLYIGITTEIETRIAQHKNGSHPNSFTARYKIDKLVYLERFARVPEAIAREKQLKNWSRIKKLNLIVSQNPTWQDLSAEWGKSISST